MGTFIQDIDGDTTRYFTKETLKKLLKKYAKATLDLLSLPPEIGAEIFDIIGLSEAVGEEIIWVTGYDEFGKVEDSAYCLNPKKVKELVEEELLNTLNDKKLKQKILAMLSAL